MKETQFIRQNKQNWLMLEERLRSKKKKGQSKESKDGAALLLKISDDLSYAQTFYKRRSIRLYLNNLSAKVFSNIYATRIKKHQAFKKFWLEELPDTFFRFRKMLGLSALLFGLAMAIGIFSVLKFPAFAEIILGTNYIAMTEENIAKGDPMAVYKGESAVDMFLAIFSNNLKVAILTFIGGLFAGIGTVGILFRNGVMVGTFQFFFLKHDLLFESFLTIWQHGTTEICSIIIAGAAGLTVGKSILFPGTLPRGVSFRIGVGNGLKILVGVAPVILLAALIESFITRHNDIGTIPQLITILLSLAFMLGYYVWLPYKRGKNFNEDSYKEQQLPESPAIHFEYNEIRNWGDTVATAIQWLQKFGFQLIIWTLGLSFALGLSAFFIDRNLFENLQNFNVSGNDFFTTLGNIIGYSFLKVDDLFATLNFIKNPLFFPVVVIVFSLLELRMAKSFNKEVTGAEKESLFPNILLPIILWSAALLPIYLWKDFFVVSLVVFLPIIGVSTFVVVNEKVTFWKAFTKAINYTLAYPQPFLTLVFITSLVTFVLIMLTQSPFIWVAIQLANDFIGYTETKALIVLEFFVVVLAYFTFLLGIVFNGISFLFFYTSTREIKEANHLKSRIEKISIRKSAYGIQKSI